MERSGKLIFSLGTSLLLKRGFFFRISDQALHSRAELVRGAEGFSALEKYARNNTSTDAG